MGNNRCTKKAAAASPTPAASTEAIMITLCSLDTCELSLAMAYEIGICIHAEEMEEDVMARSQDPSSFTNLRRRLQPTDTPASLIGLSPLTT